MNNLCVYVPGIGGLGNCLFQIFTAVYYKEKYGIDIKLKHKSASLFYGTGNKFGRIKNKICDGKVVPYNRTILRNFKWYVKEQKNYKKIDTILPNNNTVPETNILLDGYCQNVEFIENYIDKFSKYLYLELDDNIFKKYKNIKNAIMVSVRVGNDFKHMKKVTRQSYINAFKKLQEMNIDISNIFIISDVSNAWEKVFNLEKEYPAIEIDEDDVTQFCIGVKCGHYILCESTFHLWIAYLGTIDKNKIAIYFDDTDITKRKLALKSWTCVKV